MRSMDDTTTPPGLTVTAACEAAHVSRATLYRAIRDGAFTAKSVANRTIIDRETFEPWARERREAARAVAAERA